jgi:hypothetical protein
MVVEMSVPTTVTVTGFLEAVASVSADVAEAAADVVSPCEPLLTVPVMTAPVALPPNPLIGDVGDDEPQATAKRRAIQAHMTAHRRRTTIVLLLEKAGPNRFASASPVPFRMGKRFWFYSVAEGASTGIPVRMANMRVCNKVVVDQSQPVLDKGRRPA